MKWLHPFFISNILLILFYPLYRYYFFSSTKLDKLPFFDTNREKQVVTGMLVLIFIKYMRYYTNGLKFVNDCFYFYKVGVLLCLFLINAKLFVWYLFAVVSVWILFKMPRYSGETMVEYVRSEHQFDAQRGNNTICIFVSDMFDSCIYVS